MTEREALIALNMLPRIGPIRVSRLISRFGSATGVLAAPEWILDGNHLTTFERRLDRADAVVLCDADLATCLWRALARGVRRWRGITIP